MRRMLSSLVIVISLALLLPGVTQPILSISGTIEKSELTEAGIELLAENLSSDSGRDNARSMLIMFSGMLGLNDIEGEVEVFQKTRSIWGTVEELYITGNGVVAAMVMLFSIIIPGVKLSLMLIAQTPVRDSVQVRLGQFISTIGKWSMADVFVVALIVSYMAGNASAGMGELLRTYARFEVGFYYFSAYCVFSILSAYLVAAANKNQGLPEAEPE